MQQAIAMLLVAFRTQLRTYSCNGISGGNDMLS